MRRDIKTLFKFDLPATDEEVRAVALQFVRKVSGFNKLSQANHAVCDRRWTTSRWSRVTLSTT